MPTSVDCTEEAQRQHGTPEIFNSVVLYAFVDVEPRQTCSNSGMDGGAGVWWHFCRTAVAQHQVQGIYLKAMPACRNSAGWRCRLASRNAPTGPWLPDADVVTCDESAGAAQ